MRMRSKGYNTWSVCLSMCLSPLILALQAPNRLMSNTNGSSATNARRIMWQKVPFGIEKPALLRIMLRDPTHQLLEGEYMAFFESRSDLMWQKHVKLAVSEDDTLALSLDSHCCPASLLSTSSVTRV